MKPLDFGGEDMFVILTYDVHRKRCGKVMKYLRQWLEHRQRSVFSGYLSTAQIRSMERGLREIIDPEYDSVILFQMNRADQITETCTKVAHETRITSMIVMPEHQRRKIAQRNNERRAREQKALQEKAVPVGLPIRGGKKVDPSAWKFRF
jgi:CRISPR-associated protein Cas2